MSKLLSFREWLTVPEAAAHLATLFKESVTESDVLRLGLDGYLRISLYLPKPVEVRYGKIDHGSGNVAPKFVETGEVVRIADVWDLAMVGAEGLAIERKYQDLVGVPGERPTEWHLATQDGVFLRVSDDVLGKLTNLSGIELLEEYMPVVRASALREFTALQSEGSEKPLRSNERNSLLTVIAALCRHANVDYEANGAAGKIVRMTEALGAGLSDETIRKILKQIPGALETRMK